MNIKSRGNRIQKIFATLSLCLLASGYALAQQERPAINPRTDTVYVSAEGKFEALPDTAVIQFNIDAHQPDSGDAYARASAAAEREFESIQKALDGVAEMLGARGAAVR